MTIASLICLNMALFGAAYFMISRLSGGLVPKPIPLRKTGRERQRGRG